MSRCKDFSEFLLSCTLFGVEEIVLIGVVKENSKAELIRKPTTFTTAFNDLPKCLVITVARSQKPRVIKSPQTVESSVGSRKFPVAINYRGRSSKRAAKLNNKNIYINTLFKVREKKTINVIRGEGDGGGERSVSW